MKAQFLVTLMNPDTDKPENLGTDAIQELEEKIEELLQEEGFGFVDVMQIDGAKKYYKLNPRRRRVSRRR